MIKSTNVIYLWCILCFSVFGSAEAESSKVTQNLIERILPGRESDFVFKRVDSKSDKDFFDIDSENGKIIISGNDSIAMASGLNWYLKHVAKCQVTRHGDQLVNGGAKLYRLAGG